jgi:hypothetical protein
MLRIFVHYIHALTPTYSDLCLRQLALENNLLHLYLKLIHTKKQEFCCLHFIYDRSKQSYSLIAYYQQMHLMLIFFNLKCLKQ